MTRRFAALLLLVLAVAGCPAFGDETCAGDACLAVDSSGCGADPTAPRCLNEGTAFFVSATGKWTNPFELSSSTWLFLVLSGLATGASWTCYFRALKVGDASKVAPVDKLSLLLVVVIAVIFLGERPSAQEWVGILMVGAGVMVLALK